MINIKLHIFSVDLACSGGNNSPVSLLFSCPPSCLSKEENPLSLSFSPVGPVQQTLSRGRRWLGPRGARDDTELCPGALRWLVGPDGAQHSGDVDPELPGAARHCTALGPAGRGLGAGGGSPRPGQAVPLTPAGGSQLAAAPLPGLSKPLSAALRAPHRRRLKLHKSAL